MKRIIFTGAQGTGKTTILNKFKEDGCKVITEVARNLSKQGVKINEGGDVEGQNKIFSTYQQLLSVQKDYVSDRGLTDVLSYTMYLAKHCKKEEQDTYKECFEQQMKELYDFYKNNQDVIYCYFPIEFDVVADGVRSTKKRFRKEIDKNIKSLLDMMGVKYLTVRGTVDERYNYIVSHT